MLNAIAEMGGAELSLLECVRCLRDSFEFRLLLPADGPLKQRAEQLGAVVDVMPWPKVLVATGETAKRVNPWKMARSAISLRRLGQQVSEWVRESQADALITNSIKCHIIGATMPKCSAPLIWYLRDGLEERVVSRRILAPLSRHCSAAICISHYIAGQARQYISNTLPLRVIYNIIDLSKFRADLPLPPDLQKAPGQLWFGVVGAITPLKGHDLFLQAAAIVAREVPDARFLIVGANPYETEHAGAFKRQLAEQVRNLGLQNNVRFLGWRSDVHQIIAGLDVLVQANRGPEGLGRSVLEAMACAVPVVAVERWGPGELVSTAQNGLLFPHLNVGAMAEHMLRLGRDRRQREYLGDNGRRWIHANLVPNVLASQVRSVINDVIAARARMQNAKPS